MRSVVVFGLVACFAASGSAQEKIFRCKNTYTNDEAQAMAQGCTPVTGGEVRVVERPVKRPATAAENKAFRDSIKPGDYSSEGLVVEVKQPLVKVQTSRGERWFRLDELDAPYKPVATKTKK